MPGDRGDQEHLDAKVTLRSGLVHPDLAPLDDGRAGGISLVSRPGEQHLWIPGTLAAERSAALQEAIWQRMPIASHLRTERLGEFTAGTTLQRSESLAITQLLVLYQLVMARAAIALGAPGSRTDRAPATSRSA